MSAEIDRPLGQLVSALPLITALGVSIGVIYDWGYFSQFDLRFFFLIGLSDHILHAAFWVIGTFAFYSVFIFTHITDRVDDQVKAYLEGPPKKQPRIIWFGSPLFRHVPLILIAIFYFIIPEELMQVISILWLISGFSNYYYIRYYRAKMGQQSGLGDMLVLAVAIFGAAYFAGRAAFHQDLHLPPQTIVTLTNRAFQNIVLLRATSDGVIVYKPEQKVFEFIRGQDIERVRVRQAKKEPNVIRAWLSQWVQ